MPGRFIQHQLKGGLTLLGESISGVQSAAMTLLVPAGAANDPADACGAATVLSDLVLRGAGSRDSHQLIDHFDGLGLQRSSGTGVHHSAFSCAGVGPKVLEALPAYADVVRRPLLPETGFEAARDLAIQALSGIDDDPRQKLLVTLRELFFPAPLGRNPMGKKLDLQRLTVETCRAEHARRYRGAGAILAMAGNIDLDAIQRQAEHLFDDLDGLSPLIGEPPLGPAQKRFEVQDSEQTHIGIACPSIPPTDPQYYPMRVALEVFGGGTSGRLFTELREKRGLVYNVWAGYSALRRLGAMLGYAGTSNERAQATLDCFVAELHRLSKGVTAAEVERARIGLKANTIMEGESTSSRASSLAQDYFTLGRVRTLEEIASAIDAVTVDRVNAYLQSNPPGELTVVIVGPKQLQWPK
jgi:predicted Zn-dependent peptidase